jgi:HPt (histidine-containing phosphotransfer) domain-containing protein
VAQLGLFRRGLMKPINAATWKYMTHSLKGASAAVGADQMNALSRVWESQALPDTPDSREAVLLAFDEALELFHDAVQAIGR